MNRLTRPFLAWHRRRDDGTLAFLLLIVYPMVGAWALAGLLAWVGWTALAEMVLWLWLLLLVMCCAVLPAGVFAPRSYGPPPPPPRAIPPPPKEE